MKHALILLLALLAWPAAMADEEGAKISLNIQFLDDATNKPVEGVTTFVYGPFEMKRSKHPLKKTAKGVGVSGLAPGKYTLVLLKPGYAMEESKGHFECMKILELNRKQDLKIKLKACTGVTGIMEAPDRDRFQSASLNCTNVKAEVDFGFSANFYVHEDGRFFLPTANILDDDWANPVYPLECALFFERKKKDEAKKQDANSATVMGRAEVEERVFKFLIPKRKHGVIDLGEILSEGIDEQE